MLKGNIIRISLLLLLMWIAKIIYGPAISTLKGKTTQQTPKAMVADEILIPPELLNKH